MNFQPPEGDDPRDDDEKMRAYGSLDAVVKESDGDMLHRLGMDGVKWAEEFCKRFPQMDEDTMRAWFANAIMAGWDHRTWQTPEYKAMVAKALDKPVAPTEADAWKWGYEYLQGRMESIGRHGWAHDCDEEIQHRIKKVGE